MTSSTFWRWITEQTEVVVFDITRTVAVDNPLMVHLVLEMLKDGWISSGKYESTVRTIQPIHARLAIL